MSFHIVVLHIVSVKKLWESFRYSDRFETILAIGSFGGCLFVDYVTLMQIIAGYESARWAGAINSIIDLGPQAIGLFNVFLADLMASFIVIGYVPGGKVGFLIGLVFSLALNVFFLWLTLDWLKEIAASLRNSYKKTIPRRKI